MASVRPRRDGDLLACVDIMRAVYRDSGYPVGGVDNALEGLRKDDRAWVAEEADGSVVGHVAMNGAIETCPNVARWLDEHPRDNAAMLARLFVRPGSRKRGVATRLVRAVEDEARGQGRRLLILALVKDQDAIRLYQRLGWEHYTTTTFRWGEGNEMDAECFASPSP
ncbi:acyl-CoA N-acyltransferase [Xylaria palmicola]|nr:acyl-CoA N-acyltransferase [Xylaria palmicola]